MNYYPLPISIKELVVSFRAPAAPPSIFVAYDFKDSQSERFFADLRSALAHSPKDALTVVANGRVEPGASWAVEVRERISKSRLMIADLSLNSVEVYFECGLSWGLGRSLCPVVRSDDRRQFLPKWLLDLQVVNYGSDSGMQELLQRIRKVGTEKNSKSRNRCESAVPGKIAIVSSATDQITHQNAIIKAACGIYGMSYTQSEAFSDRELAVELPRSIADASLLIINIQGDFSEADLFGIFCTGAILSHPSSGIDTKKLLKQVLIVTHGASPESIKIFPDSAKRIRNVKIISPNALTKEVHSFGVNYRKWVLLQATATKGSQDAKKPIGR